MQKLKLKENEIKALQKLKESLVESFPDVEIILYGSKARGDFEEESDIDLLVLINGDVDDTLREKIFSIGFKVELNCDVIFGIIVESKDFWQSEKAGAMPIHWSIDKEGIPVI